MALDLDSERIEKLAEVLRVSSFSTLQCGSWIDAAEVILATVISPCFSTLQCGSWIDALAHDGVVNLLLNAFQYPSMRVVD